MSAWPEDEPHDVYWLYDAEDRVLYIGCTHLLESRLRQHMRIQEWWPRVSRVEVEGFVTMAPARAREGAAIYDERPVFNKRVAKPKPALPPIIRRDEPIHVVEASAS